MQASSKKQFSSLPFPVESQGDALSSFEQLQFATEVIRTEAEALSQLASQVPTELCDAVAMVLSCTGAVIVTGVGKAGWVGQKVSASLASTGTPSHFLHPAEAFHGDLGRVQPNDLILAFSNSGETNEVLQLLPSFEKFGNSIIAITGKPESTLATKAAVSLCYGKQPEVCHLGLAPSTSTTLMLALGDALTLVTSKSRNFTASQFAKFHPGGSLGKKLSHVEDIMRPIAECRVALESETVRDIYVRAGGGARRAGVVLVTDGGGCLTGIFTDSDLARLLERQQDNLFDSSICDVMTKSPVTISAGSKTMLAIETLACRNLSELPVIDREGKPTGLVDITDVVSLA